MLSAAAGEEMTMNQLMMLAVVVLMTVPPKLHAAGLVVKADNAYDDDYASPDMSHIDPMDLCLFICHSCYEQVSFNVR